MTVVLAAAAAALFGCGTYLLLQRQLTRIIIGLALLAHGANLLVVLSAGGRGQPTFVDGEAAGNLLDPLPQAFVLTAIVITFGTTSFLLALAYRSWLLTRDDEVQDDIEDRLVAARRRPGQESVDVRAAADAADLDVTDLDVTDELDDPDDPDDTGEPGRGAP